MSKADMDVLEFARRICMLQTAAPLADAFDRRFGQRQNRWWSCQREHLTAWCLCYPAGGVKGYTHAPSSSAKQMYNHFGRPETLLWLAEALGEDKALLAELCSSPCTAADVRRAIPFSRILELLPGSAEETDT